MKLKSLAVASALIFLGIGVTPFASASLVDRSGGLIYDTDLNITWLQHPNLARADTFGIAGISGTGSMTWDTAQLWIGALNAQNYLGYDNWRLPKTAPSNLLAFSYDGTTDLGFNITNPANEMAHLFYVTLGNYGLYDTLGNLQLASNQANTKGVFNPYIDTANSYWTGATSEPLPYTAYSFSMTYGSADLNNKVSEMYAWAIRDGDVTSVVTSVPEPTTYTILLAGLGLLASTRRNREHT